MLHKQGYDGTGTLRANRLEKSCPLKSQSFIDKSARGSFDCVPGALDDTEVNVTRWKDKAVVTAASTLLRKHTVGEVSLWSKADKKHIQVKIPNVINIYNQHMGGTDRIDQAWIFSRCAGKNNIY